MFAVARARLRVESLHCAGFNCILSRDFLLLAAPFIFATLENMSFVRNQHSPARNQISLKPDFEVGVYTAKLQPLKNNYTDSIAKKINILGLLFNCQKFKNTVFDLSNFI